MSEQNNSDNSHSTYIEMICAAITDKTNCKIGGVSRTVISNCIQKNYDGLASAIVSKTIFNTSLDTALEKGIESGILEYQKYNTKKYKISSSKSHSKRKLRNSGKPSISRNNNNKICTCNRPFIEWNQANYMSIVRHSTAWNEPKVPIQQLNFERWSIAAAPLYYTGKYSPYKPCLFLFQRSKIYKYDIEQNEFMLFASYPSEWEHLGRIHPVLNQDNHKLYFFTWCYQFDRNKWEEKNKKHELWCLDLTTAEWTNCNMNESLLLRKCKSFCVKDKIHIFYGFYEGFHHEKYDLNNSSFNVASDLAIKSFPESIWSDGVNIAKVVHFKARNELIMFDYDQVFDENREVTDVPGQKNVWICNLNATECKWNRCESIQFPLNGMVLNGEDFVAIAALDHFVLLFHLRSLNWVRKVLDVWCLDLLSKQCCLSEKYLPEFVGDDLKGLIETDNEYIHYLDRKDHHFRFSVLDIIPLQMKRLNGELCKKFVYGFVRQRVETKYELTSNVPTMLKNIILGYFTYLIK